MRGHPARGSQQEGDLLDRIAPSKVETLNAIRFAGYNDWRVPNVNELYSLVNVATEFPAMSLAFNWGCVPGCTYLTCSCAGDFFGITWTSTTVQSFPGNAFILWFSDGDIFLAKQHLTYAVRAVRGGI